MTTLYISYLKNRIFFSWMTKQLPMYQYVHEDLHLRQTSKYFYPSKHQSDLQKKKKFPTKNKLNKLIIIHIFNSKTTKIRKERYKLFQKNLFSIVKMKVDLNIPIVLEILKNRSYSRIDKFNRSRDRESCFRTRNDGNRKD